MGYSLRIFVLPSLILLSSVLPAQTITVRMINARTGKPVGHKNVTVLWGDSRDETVMVIDGSGVGHVVVPSGKASFGLLAGPKIGKEPGRIAYETCSDPPLQHVSIAEVVERGYAPSNGCGRHIHVYARPGEVVYYIRLLHWWQVDRQ